MFFDKGKSSGVLEGLAVLSRATARLAVTGDTFLECTCIPNRVLLERMVSREEG